MGRFEYKRAADIDRPKVFEDNPEKHTDAGGQNVRIPGSEPTLNEQRTQQVLDQKIDEFTQEIVAAAQEEANNPAPAPGGGGAPGTPGAPPGGGGGGAPGTGGGGPGTPTYGNPQLLSKNLDAFSTCSEGGAARRGRSRCGREGQGVEGDAAGAGLRLGRLGWMGLWGKMEEV